MAVNPDPRPGRWILPLVILAMIGFTFFFVSALPEAEPDTTLAGAATTTTIDESAETTEPGDGGPLDDETQTYLDELDAINADLQVVETEIVTVNAGFDTDPREIPYGEAETRLEAAASDSQALADRVAALSVPAGLELNQAALQSALDICAAAATEALEGLRSTDTGQLRRAALEAYTTSAGDFDTEVQNAKNAAGAA